MPPHKSIRRKSLGHSNVYPALLAAVLAVLVASLIGVSSPQAASGADKSAPSAPENLHLLGATQWSATVAWSPSSDNVGVEGYRVTFGSPRRAKTTETQYTEAGLACGISYTVEVQAYDHVRNLSPAARAVVSSAPCLDTAGPSPPTGLRQAAASSSTASLAWNASTDNVAVAGYAVSRGGVEIDQTTETSYVFVGLNCGSTYPVAVRAYDVAGNDSSWAPFYLSTSACGDVTPPSAPSGLVQLDRTQTSMSFAWSASTDNVGVAKYAVFRGATQVAETTALTYALPGLTCGTAYTIGAEAVDGAGNRSQRTTATMSTASCTQPPPGGDTQPPSNPTGLAITSATQSSIGLSWSAASDNVGVAGYDVYRDGVRVHVVPDTSYAFAGLSCGTSYLLGVAAYDAAGNRSGTVSVTAATSPCSDSSPPSTPANLVLLNRTATSVTVSWAASSDNVGVAGYGAYRDGTLVGSTGETTYTFTGLACGTSRTFGIDAYDAAGNRSARTSVILQTAACGDSQAPSTPTQLAVSGITQTGATLNWAASSDNVAVAGYDVFLNGTKVATVTGTSSAVGTLTCNTGYTLGVEAFDASGNRSSRATVSATTAACSAPPPPPPPTGGANRYVSPSGSDSSTCTQSAPCASFDRAYQVATPGDTVLVTGGSYPSQVLEWMPGRDSAAQVKFVPQSPVTINGSLEIAASGVYFDGSATGSITSWKSRTYSFEVTVDTTIEGRSSSSYPHNVTVEGMDVGSFGTYSSENVIARDIDVGPVMLDWNGGCTRPENKIGSNGAAAGVVPKNVLYERVVFHEINRTLAAAEGNCHNGGLFVITGDGITIRESVFSQTVVYDLFVQNFGNNPTPQNVLIENNWFGCPVENAYTPNGTTTCNGQRALQFQADSLFTNWTIRYNSFVSGLMARDGASFSSVKVIGNAGDGTNGGLCEGGVTWSRNAFVGGTSSCGTATSLPSLPFLNSASSQENLRLLAGSAAIDAGDPASFPSNDIDGAPRPQGSAPDAGSDEAG